MKGMHFHNQKMHFHSIYYIKVCVGCLYDVCYRCQGHQGYKAEEKNIVIVGHLHPHTFIESTSWFVSPFITDV